MPTFREALAGNVLVFDGAMGTEIYRHHVFTNRSFDELCLSDPKLIQEIHEQYCDAGADVLTTNTFGANRLALAKYGLAEKTAQINVAGARLAREVADRAGRAVFVAGSIGPLPPQPQHEDALAGMIVRQATALLEGGADFIIFETLPTRAALERAAAALRQLPETPFVLSAAIVGQCESASGEPIGRMLAPLPQELPAPVAWGMNCGSGPDGLLSAVEAAVGVCSGPLIVQPNAGMPKEVENRRIYFCSPEYLTTYARRYVELGASAVGGCCGTTPDHIREIARAVKPLSRAQDQAGGGAGASGGAARARPVCGEIAAGGPAGAAAMGGHRGIGAAARL